MGADGPVRQEQPLADLLVGETVGGEPADLQLLRSERDRRRRPAGRRARGAQLAGRLVLPRSGAENAEAVERSHQVNARFAGGPRPPEVLAVGELDPRVLEGPAIDVLHAED